MASLHIQHPVTDLATWTSAYNAFGEKRRRAGVLAETIRRPIDDDHYVVVDLDFATEDQAAGFLHFLETVVWADSVNSPGLAGAPETRILTTVDVAATAS